MADLYGIGGTGTRPCGRSRMSRASRLAVLGAVATTLSLVLASGAQASVPQSFFGTVPWRSFQGKDYERLDNAHVRNARTPFFWPNIEPKRDQFNWSGTDHFVGTAALYHVRTLPFLNGSPSWVARDPRTAPVQSSSAQKSWTQFVKACVARYGPNGKFWRLHPEIPKVPITSWQIWNEQNNANYYGPQPNPRGYAKLVRLARNALRSVDKNATVVLGGMAGDAAPENSMKATAFLRKLYGVKGGKNLFDVVAVHPYSPTVRNMKRQMGLLRKVIKRRRDDAKMWITEVGWGSAPKSDRWPLLKGPEGQKEILKQAFHAMLKNRKRWRLQRVYWFLWRDAAPDDHVNCSFCRSAGLFTYDFKPKPAWNAFLSFSRR